MYIGCKPRQTSHGRHDTDATPTAERQRQPTATVTKSNGNKSIQAVGNNRPITSDWTPWRIDWELMPPVPAWRGEVLLEDSLTALNSAWGKLWYAVSKWLTAWYGVPAFACTVRVYAVHRLAAASCDVAWQSIELEISMKSWMLWNYSWLDLVELDFS